MPDTQHSLLVVDDDPALRITICEFLTALGYQVRMAEHGLAGLAEIQNEEPAILVSDLNMPHMSGFELLSIVRRSFPAIRTIAMSGTVCAADLPVTVVADAFFQKGNQLPGLVKVIESLPARRQRSVQREGLAPVAALQADESASASHRIAISRYVRR